MSLPGCNVCLYGDDDFDNEFFSQIVRRAVKPHSCCECGRTIEPGERYETSSGKSDGSVWTYATCSTCQEIREGFYCEGGHAFGTLWEMMADQAFESLTTASPCFSALSPSAKEAVMDRWRAWKGLEARRAGGAG